MINFIKILLCTSAALISLSFVNSEKFKFCYVDGKGGFKRASRYCPVLDSPDSKVECVLGIDRLDCLRRISKGKVDFSVFNPEDLVTAANSEVDVLLTTELRYLNTSFDYEVVAVINKNSKIKSRHDLKGKNLCHPGFGYENDEWTKVLLNYLDSLVIPPLCQTNLTITENRIKATSDFWGSACKAGPWVNYPILDERLKLKYPNMCGLCGNPTRCSKEDKYYGRSGSLFCLTDGAGDISWSRLDDVKQHFGLLDTIESREVNGNVNDFEFLCPDDTVQPLTSAHPCVWAVRPWSVVVTKQTIAQEFQEFFQTVTLDTGSDWKKAFKDLVLSYYSMIITPIKPVEAIESYLDRAKGFLNANSFSGCHPPRTIHICVKSILEFAKCGWLRESAAAYGIEPDLECLKADNTSHCMQAVNTNVADIVMVPPDALYEALQGYNFKTLFYETTSDEHKNLIWAVVKNSSSLATLEDIKNARACFPSYQGMAWNSVFATLKSKGLLSHECSEDALVQHFKSICAPNLPKTFRQSCKIDFGDFNAIQCVLSGDGDVAFISGNSLNDFIQQSNDKVKMTDFKILRENKSDQKKDSYYLSWAPLSQAMVKSDRNDVWIEDTLDVFLQLDNLFGKESKFVTTPLQMFGLFDGQPNILFHDNTIRLKTTPKYKKMDRMERLYEDILNKSNITKQCQSLSSKNTSSIALVMFLIVLIKSIVF